MAAAATAAVHCVLDGVLCSPAAGSQGTPDPAHCHQQPAWRVQQQRQQQPTVCVECGVTKRRAGSQDTPGH
jgi:hypothetical protein